MALVFSPLQTIASFVFSVLSSPNPRKCESNHTPAELLSLPFETLARVMEYPDWDDILRLRQCCSVLHGVSRTRSVWLVLLKRYCDTVFPRSFFLKKPLEHCTAIDLEEAVTNWWKPLPPLSGDQPWREIEPPEGVHLRMTGITPDGRCFLFTTPNGAIYYYDVDRPREPHLLVPALDETCFACTRFTFDYLEMQAIDSTDPSLVEDRLFPTGFKMAVARHGERTNGTAFAIIEVWQITAILQEGLVHGYLSERLASFHEEQHLFIKACSLYGKHLAYACRNSFLVIIVEWTQLPSQSTAYPRVYMRMADAERISLLPRQRILTHSRYQLKIWDWGRIPVSYLMPSEEGPRMPGPASPVQYARSSWRHECSFPIYMERSLVPFVTNSSVRFVLLAVDGFLGLTISTDEIEAGANPVMVTLVKGGFSTMSGMLQDYNYQRGVGVSSEDEGASQAVWYMWPDLKCTPNLLINAFPGPRNAGAIYLSETLNCIHIFDSHSLKYTSVYSKSL